jgi:hypothetical protein
MATGDNWGQLGTTLQQHIERCGGRHLVNIGGSVAYFVMRDGSGVEIGSSAAQGGPARLRAVWRGKAH